MTVNQVQGVISIVILCVREWYMIMIAIKRVGNAHYTKALLRSIIYRLDPDASPSINFVGRGQLQIDRGFLWALPGVSRNGRVRIW